MNFTFDSMRGSVRLRGEELDLFVRPGIDGTGARRTGARGKPFTVETVRYVASFQDAKDTLANYRLLRGQEPVTLIKQSVNWGTYLVLDVEETEARAVANAIGTIVTNPTVRQVVRWTLLG